jgi:hypothetical protein
MVVFKIDHGIETGQLREVGRAAATIRKENRSQ